MGFVFQDLNLIADDAGRYSRRFPIDKWGTPRNQRAFPRERILVWATYWMDYKLHGLDADGWRRSSMALHVVTAGLLFPLSPMAALLFLLHPLTLMGSSYVAGRSGLMSGLFQIISALFAMNAHLILAVLTALVALRWVKQDSVVFLPMIGMLWTTH